MYKTMLLVLAAASVGVARQAHTQETSGRAGYYPMNSYANPDETTTRVTKQRGPCSDPWVTMALTRVYGAADAGKCDAKLYNGGSWGSYNELIHAVALTLPLTAKAINDFQINLYRSGTLFAVLANERYYLVGNDGASLIGNDGSTLRLADLAKLIGNDTAGAQQVVLSERLISNASVFLQPLAGYKLMSGRTSYSALKAATRRR